MKMNTTYQNLWDAPIAVQGNFLAISSLSEEERSQVCNSGSFKNLGKKKRIKLTKSEEKK